MQLAYDRCGYDIFAGLLFKQGNSQRNEKQKTTALERNEKPPHTSNPTFQRETGLKGFVAFVIFMEYTILDF